MRFAAHCPRPARRAGFTLVELLVAAALSVLVLAIIAQAFATATATFSGLKSIGTLADGLRNAQLAMLADLDGRRVIHLETASDAPQTVAGLRQTGAWSGSGGRGYFRVNQGTGTPEGHDPDLNVADDPVRATGDWFAFTSKVIRGGGTPVYTAKIPTNGTPFDALWAQRAQGSTSPTLDATTYASEWAEHVYFLASSGQQTTPDPPQTSVPLFTLYRQTRALARSPSVTTALPPDIRTQRPSAEGWAQIGVYQSGSTGLIHNPESIASRANRDVPTPVPLKDLLVPSLTTGDELYGSDILLMNVVSMRVRTLMGEFPGATPAGRPTALRFIDTATTGVPWDTGVSPTFMSGDFPGVCFVPQAIQIKLRVYDTKNGVTRQVTSLFPI